MTKAGPRNLGHQIDALPWLARTYRAAFRSGSAESSSLSRFCYRALYYMSHSFRRTPAWGQITLSVGGFRRSIRFDARNRQFNVLYFDKYKFGYEPDVTALMAHFLPQNGVLFDVGSNWGYFPLLVASQKSFSGKVHAFEPMPTTFRDLTSVIEQAGLCERVTCHELALDDSNGMVSMDCPSHSGLAQVRPQGGRFAVNQCRLDDLNLESPDFIKLDAEGAEESVLNGARRVLRKSRPMVTFENNRESRSADSTLKLLEALGYQLFCPAHETTHNESTNTVEPYSDSSTQDSLSNDYLRLLPITRRTRSFYAPYLNLFACARERIEQVAHCVEEPLPVSACGASYAAA